MIYFPNAKINIGLNIVGKRTDGYHDIETVFYPIPIEDALEFAPQNEGRGTTLAVTGIAIDGATEDNLILKAYRMMRECHILPELDIRLRKNIPFGAGLGGGSSDASFMLMLLNDEFRLGLSETELIKKARKIGSDCPFFIKNKPVFATGRGDEFQEFELSLSGMRLVLVKPADKVSTKEAYAQCCPQRPSQRLTELIKRPVGEWRGEVVNDFEKSVFESHPRIRAIKETLYAMGAVYASMSGSGSSVFGLFAGDYDYDAATFVQTFKGEYLFSAILS